ncbi:MAG: acyltransferase family protein [Akkermansia sp.]
MAILLVVMFHLNSQWFPCCFYGVDVFLVITGYLLFRSMSRLKTTGEGCCPAILNFCYRKLQRIMPPVAAVLLVTMLVGIVLLDDRVLAEECRLARYTLLGMSNIHLAKRAADYFAAGDLETPFMPMWYIGVTLQVYLLFLLGKITYDRLPQRWRRCMLVVIGVASLALCYSMNLHDGLAALGLPTWHQEAAPSYFETLPRLWEVLAGGLVCVLPAVSSRRVASLLSGAGVAAILLPALLFREQSTALFPLIVGGTVAVIRYTPGSLLAPLLGNKLLLSIGGISFSLYLVHMPIFECYRSWLGVSPSAADAALMLLLAALLSILCWFVVEKRRLSYRIWVPLYLLTLLISIAGKKTDGFACLRPTPAGVELLSAYRDWSTADPRFYQQAFEAESICYNNGVFDLIELPIDKHESDRPVLCLGDGNAAPTFVLLGDSHAQASYAGLDAFCKEHHRAGVYLTTIFSPFRNRMVPSFGFPYYCNREKVEAIERWLVANPHIQQVVVATFWEQRMQRNRHDWNGQPADMSTEAQTACLREFLQHMQALGKQTILLLPYPCFDRNPLKHVRWLIRRGKGLHEFSEAVTQTREAYERDNATSLRMLRQLEAEGLCSLLDPCANRPDATRFCAVEDGVLLFKDSDHLSVRGSVSFMRSMAPQLLRLLPEATRAPEEPNN